MAISFQSTGSRAAIRLACAVATAALLAGCSSDVTRFSDPFSNPFQSASGNSDTTATGSIALDDYHARHPIVLAQAPTTLEVFPMGRGGLDEESTKDVQQFAARYKAMGTSRIVILTPSTGGYRIHATVDEIRRVLVSAGLRGSVGLTSYPVADASLASPILLKFLGVKAEVASRCGQWPHDLASGSSLEGWKNVSYWNFGCATQSALAAQIDDPRDFVRARSLGPSDDAMRLRAIQEVRNGQDPGTNWSVQLTPIGQIGGN